MKRVLLFLATNLAVILVLSVCANSVHATKPAASTVPSIMSTGAQAAGSGSANTSRQPPAAARDAAPGAADKSGEAQTSGTVGAAAVAPDTIIGRQRAAAMHEALIGQWVAAIGGKALILSFEPPDAFQFGDMHGRFAVGSDATLTLSSDTAQQTYLIDLDGPQLTLTSAATGALRTPIKFVRKSAPLAWVSKWFDINPRQAADKLWHIVMLLILVAAAQLVLAVIRWLSRVAVYGNSGLLGRLYYSHKKRARTIHLLILNVIKYVVYLTALGMILAELGVNVGAYLVSLSVVGLAIGFGSQDLVRDMVTGFFVVFENQYDVGDMVDIAGQTGVVTEIGLRMTRLRNYMGQTMFIPNRTIEVVGKYEDGAQLVNMDVQIDGADAAATVRGQDVMLAVAKKIHREFSGVVLAQPALNLDDKGDSNGHVRLELPIWPGQSWLVDQCLVPQLREALGAADLPIVGDRLTVFYRRSEPVDRPRTRRS